MERTPGYRRYGIPPTPTIFFTSKIGFGSEKLPLISAPNKQVDEEYEGISGVEICKDLTLYIYTLG